jgi:YesN/AraC family two-component response regulator
MTPEPICFLIVDDEPGIRAVLREIIREELEGTVCILHEAGDGLEALDVLKDKGVDIVVTDMKMPNLDGLGLLHQIRLNHRTVTVIVMTGYSEDYTREEALRLGAQDYITKPFDVDEVRLILMKSCMKVEAGREGGP